MSKYPFSVARDTSKPVVNIGDISPRRAPLERANLCGADRL